MGDKYLNLTQLQRFYEKIKTLATGTVTKVSTGAGLTGGDITDTGTIKAKLKSETQSTLTAADKGSTSSREYAVGLDASGNLSVNVPWSNDDTKNTAGSMDSSSKLFLIGATSQAANPRTYSHDTAYVGTDGCLYSGGTKVLTSHQDLSGKKDVQSAIGSPSASGTAVAFIDTISQNAQGVITPTKKTVRTATTSLNGLMSATDKTNLNSVVSGRLIKVTIASFSSLPQTVSNGNITANHEVVHSVLGTPSAQSGAWTVTTSNGSLTVSGNISGSTTLTLYLEVPTT